MSYCVFIVIPPNAFLHPSFPQNIVQIPGRSVSHRLVGWWWWLVVMVVGNDSFRRTKIKKKWERRGFFPFRGDKKGWHDRQTIQTREQNRTEKKRAQHSTTQQQNVRSLRACFFFPSFAGVGPRGFQLLLFQIHVYVYVCVCVFIYRIQGGGEFLTWLGRLVPWSSFWCSFF